MFGKKLPEWVATTAVDDCDSLRWAVTRFSKSSGYDGKKQFCTSYSVGGIYKQLSSFHQHRCMLMSGRLRSFRFMQPIFRWADWFCSFILKRHRRTTAHDHLSHHIMLTFSHITTLYLWYRLRAGRTYKPQFLSQWVWMGRWITKGKREL